MSDASLAQPSPLRTVPSLATGGTEAPLADIEVGLSVEQAGKIVSELDALWSNSTRDGKKKVHELRRLHETLTAALAIERAL